jgi:hypothetical protein
MSDIPQIPTLTTDDAKVITLLQAESNDWTHRGFESALLHLAYAHRIESMDAAGALGPVPDSACAEGAAKR